jgi:integrase
VSGRYEIAFRDSDGRLRFRTVDGSFEDAKALRAELVGKVRKGARVAPSRLTFSDYADEWIAGLDLRPRTIEGYRYRLERHLRPRFGRRKLAEITTDDVARMVAELKRAGYAGWTVNSVLTALSPMMRRAERRGLIAANPVRGLERGERATVENGEKRILDEAELGKLLAGKSSYRVLIALLAFSGLRLGEALGLVWDDVDFEQGFIHVRGQLSRKRERVVEKTAGSRREVVLVPQLAKILREHRMASRFKASTDFVFPAPDGRVSCTAWPPAASSAQSRRLASRA